jgi:membrane-associated phospholipid phosphatase
LLSIVWFLYFIAVSLSRIALQKHYPIDVLWWVVFGVIIVWLSIFFEQYILWFVSLLLKTFI